jgi:hypothetical protein
MSTIQDYLKQARATGAVPTFTNIGGENPMLQPGPGRPMGGPQQPGAYYMEEPGGRNPMMDAGGQVTPAAPAPAIPAQGQNIGQSQVGQQDPWVMAQEATKGMLPNIWEQLFPGKQPGSELNPAEMTMWRKAVQSTRNAMVDRFKYQIDQTGKEKDREIRAQGQAPKDELSIQQRAKFWNDYKNEYAKIVNDPMNPQSKVLAGMTADQYAAQQLEAMERGIGKQAIPEQGQLQGQLQGQPQGQPTASQYPTSPGQYFQQGDPMQLDLHSEIQALAEKYGRTPEGRAKAEAELRQRYPSLKL